MKISMLSLLTWSFTTAAFAAGNGHASGPGSLLFPAFNLAIFIGLIVWKTRQSFKDFFHNRSKQIIDSYERAQLRAKEAEIKQSHVEEKLRGMEKELTKIKKENSELMLQWESKVVRDYQTRVRKLRTDAEQRLEAEKKSTLDRLLQEMVGRVIQSSKTSLNNDPGAKEKVGKNILEGLKS